MKIITCPGEIKLKRARLAAKRGSVVSIGVFDGLHIGHRKIIRTQVRLARSLGIPSAVITFSRHPSKVLEPGNAPPLLISLEHRLRLMEGLGADIAVVLRFTRALSRLSPEGFVKKYLVAALGARSVVVGPGFFFGRFRDGDAHLLKRLGQKYGFGVVQVAPVVSEGIEVSSTYVRRLIREGMLDEAQKLLGRPVSVLGTVTRGSSLGRELGYPTANVDPHHEVIPPSGVYAVKVKYKNKTYGGILNIGTRPTFSKGESREPAVEVHIFDFKRKIYGEDLQIDFVRKIRPEKKFPSRAALVGQIRKDEALARRILINVVIPK